MQLELWTNDNNRTARVIDAFAEQVLAKAAALAFKHVAERFQRPIASTSYRATVPSVVEQGVHGLLQHSLFVANNNVGCFEQEEIFEPIIAIDHPAIQIIQVRGGKTSAFQRNQRTQVRWNHRQHVQNHPFRTRMRTLESLDELETLGQFLANLLALCGTH